MLAVPVNGTFDSRVVAARFLKTESWDPDPEHVLFTGNGRQAIAAALSAFATVGGRVGVEALTYPVVKGILAKLGLSAVPIATDRDGMRPDSIAAAHKLFPLQAIYLQPVMQNPLGTTMSETRCGEIGDLSKRCNLAAIEDAVYSFLATKRPRPLAFHAPDHVVFVESLSKRLSPGFTLGIIVAPRGYRYDLVSKSIRAGAWTANGFSLEFGRKWLDCAAVGELEKLKRQDAEKRQSIASQKLRGIKLQRDVRSYHIWVELPDAWRADTFVAAAAQRGIAVTPGARFAVAPGDSPNAVRLALAFLRLSNCRRRSRPWPHSTRVILHQVSARPEFALSKLRFFLRSWLGCYKNNPADVLTVEINPPSFNAKQFEK